MKEHRESVRVDRNQRGYNFNRRLPRPSKNDQTIPEYRPLRRILIKGQPAILTYSNQTKQYLILLGRTVKDGKQLGSSGKFQEALRKSEAMVRVKTPTPQVGFGQGLFRNVSGPEDDIHI
jgi:hypothetical protein